MVKYSFAVAVLSGVTLFSDPNNLVVNAFQTPLSTTTNVLRSSSFLPTHKQPHTAFTLTRSTTQALTTTMLIEPSGKDALKSLSTPTSSTPSINKHTPNTSKLRNVLSTASIPAGAIMGFVLTPSRRIVANTIGAGITGIIGSVGKSKLDAMSAELAKPAIAGMLHDNFDSWDTDTMELRAKVLEMAQSYKVDVENGDLVVIAMDIYTQYLLAMCKNPYAKTTELKELSNLRSIFNLSSLDLGEAHANAATEFFRTTCLFTPEEELQDEGHPDRMRLDKLLWLSSRSIVQSEEQTTQSSSQSENDDVSGGAYIFEMSRIAKALKVSFPEEVRDRLQSVAEPFYERALTSTRVKLDTGAVSAAMLDRARQTLGIDGFVKRDMHLNCYTEEVRSLLGLEGASSADSVEDESDGSSNMDHLVFPENTQERLKQLQSVLEIEDDDAEYELANEITPIFQKTVFTTFEKASNDEDVHQLWESIKKRQSELCLSDTAMKPLIESAVVQTLGTPLDAAMNFARVSNESGAHESLLKALQVKRSVFEVLKEYPELTSSSGDDEESSSTTLEELFFSPTSKSSACGFLPPEDRQKLYTLFLSRTIKDSVAAAAATASDESMSQESESQLSEVATLLAMSDYQVSDAARSVCGPLVEKELKAAAFEVTGDDWTPVLVENLSKRIDELIQKLKVPDSLVKEYAMNVYKDSLKVVALKCPNGIPTSELSEQLNSLQSLLKLTAQDVSAMHYAAFGATYKKSVLESMGITGVIRPEFRSPLEDLIVRLGIDADDAKKLYFSAVQDKMKPMVQLLANELERSILTQQQLAQKRGVDMGQDVFQGGAGPTGKLGIGTDGNIMGEIMNLIDFYKENDVLVKTQTGTKTVEKTVDDEKVTEEVPIYENSYPVTALGMSAIDADMADALYRQFVVGGFQAQGEQQMRYEAETATFGGILGLSKEQMDSVGGSIGSMVYENYIKNALRTKDSLDQQDMMFLATMQQKLNLNGEQGAEMMQAAQKKVMFEQANAVFENPTSASIKSLREKCNSMGLEMYEDVGLPKDRLESMFAIEVTNGIDADEISPESGELLTEIQESLGLSPEDCERILGGIVERKTVDAVYNIEKELLRGRDDNCVSEIKDMLKYAIFVGGEVDGIEVSEETANKIINIYDSVDASGTDADLLSRNKDLLKVALGLV